MTKFDMYKKARALGARCEANDVDSLIQLATIYPGRFESSLDGLGQRLPEYASFLMIDVPAHMGGGSPPNLSAMTVMIQREKAMFEPRNPRPT